MAKVIYRLKGAEREQVERMYRDLIALNGAYSALINSVAAREKVPQGAKYDPDHCQFVPQGE